MEEEESPVESKQVLSQGDEHSVLCAQQAGCGKATILCRKVIGSPRLDRVILSLILGKIKVRRTCKPFGCSLQYTVSQYLNSISIPIRLFDKAILKSWLPTDIEKVLIVKIAASL
jgi:hypothetical protein